MQCINASQRNGICAIEEAASLRRCADKFPTLPRAPRRQRAMRYPARIEHKQHALGIQGTCAVCQFMHMVRNPQNLHFPIRILEDKQHALGIEGACAVCQFMCCAIHRICISQFPFWGTAVHHECRTCACPSRNTILQSFIYICCHDVNTKSRLHSIHTTN